MNSKEGVSSRQRNGWRKADKKPVANQDLWERMLEAVAPNHVTFQWVKGHSGDPMNERCDELATAEAAFAPYTDGYWTAAGNPRSAVEGRHMGPGLRPSTPMPADAPPGPERPAGTEAMRILEAMSAALDECNTFESFRARMRDVLDDVAW